MESGNCGKLQDSGKTNTNWQDVGAWLRALHGNWTDRDPRVGTQVPDSKAGTAGCIIVVSTLRLCFPYLLGNYRLQFYKPAASSPSWMFSGVSEMGRHR